MSHANRAIHAAAEAARIDKRVSMHTLHQEFLSFLRAMDKAVPPELDIHLIVDNYATHKHARVKAWLRVVHAGKCISSRLTVLGSTRQNASLR